METIKTLYNLLNIKRKIQHNATRITYLKDVWGLEQNTIAELEKCSQSQVSKLILFVRKSVPRETFLKAIDIRWTVDEIKFIQFLPREIISDVEVVAFVNNILGLEVHHPLFDHYEYAVNLRIAALAKLGIQNKHLVQIFNKSQPTVSMIVKRFADRSSVERPNRYDSTAPYTISPQKRKTNFILAGGQS